MRTSSRLLLLAATLLAFGCATRQLAPRADVPCVPDSVGDPEKWTNPQTAYIRLKSDGEEPVPGLKATFDTPKGPVVTYWAYGAIAAIDPAPGNNGVPALYDTGLVTPEGAVIVGGTPSCTWKVLGGAEA